MKAPLNLLLATSLLIFQPARAELIRHWQSDGTFDEEIASDTAVPVNGTSFGTDRLGNASNALNVDGSRLQ